jgi:tetratricopeptide (TPR) repeat protein
VETDTQPDTLPASYPMSQIAIYAGWYAGDANGPFTLPKVEFMPGAFAYHLYSFSADSLRTPTGHWCGPLLAKGATCTMGCVYEPFLQFTPNIAFFLQAFGNGYTFGEAAWASQMALSWQTTVIGDPLYQPFKKNPALLHAELTRSHNPLLEWSFLRLVNLDLAHGVRGPVLTRFLENIPTTATSAVLTEKLAELYDQLGKPESAINAWQHALTLNPSPQQRIRIRRVLEEKLLAQNRITDALENDRQFIAEAPDYPGRPAIEEKLKSLQSAAENKKP